mmetsp:Transcript_31412/g.55274  ORF Transcript_31412/g.55274 Transcript_31412/m.55274 type:complete len:326 (-) Transcript_31412:1746-2723(-)
MSSEPKRLFPPPMELEVVSLLLVPKSKGFEAAPEPEAESFGLELADEPEPETKSKAGVASLLKLSFLLWLPFDTVSPPEPPPLNSEEELRLVGFAFLFELLVVSPRPENRFVDVDATGSSVLFFSFFSSPALSPPKPPKPPNELLLLPLSASPPNGLLESAFASPLVSVRKGLLDGAAGVANVLSVVLVSSLGISKDSGANLDPPELLSFSVAAAFFESEPEPVSSSSGLHSLWSTSPSPNPQTLQSPWLARGSTSSSSGSPGCLIRLGVPENPPEAEAEEEPVSCPKPDTSHPDPDPFASSFFSEPKSKLGVAAPPDLVSPLKS